MPYTSSKNDEELWERGQDNWKLYQIRQKDHIISTNKNFWLQINCWELTILLKFKEPLQSKTQIIIKPIETSYEIICADDLKQPKKA